MTPPRRASLASDASASMTRLAEAIEGVTPHLKDIAKNTSVIAANMDGLKRFSTYWLPWICTGVALVYPKLAHFIQEIPLGIGK